MLQELWRPEQEREEIMSVPRGKSLRDKTINKDIACLDSGLCVTSQNVNHHRLRITEQKSSHLRCGHIFDRVE